MMSKWITAMHEKLDQMMEMIKALQEFGPALEEMKAALTRLETQQGEVLQAARGMRPQASRVPETTMQTDPTMRGESRPTEGQMMPGVKPNRPTGRGK